MNVGMPFSGTPSSLIKNIKVVMPFSGAPSVAQQHPDNQFSIQKRAGHFEKKYKYGDAAKRYPSVSTSFLINNIKAVTPSALIKTIKVVIPFSGDAL